MGFGEWFTFKSAKQRAREEKQFARWAFPYGEAQKEKIAAIIKDLLPKEDPRSAMAVFLMGRQAYRGSFKDDQKIWQSVPTQIKWPHWIKCWRSSCLAAIRNSFPIIRFWFWRTWKWMRLSITPAQRNCAAVQRH